MLTDAERGRLYSALYRYAKTGRKEELSGNERYVYAVIVKQIDLHNVRAEAGKKGGLTKKDQFATSKTEANSSKPKQSEANSSKNSGDNTIYNNTNNNISHKTKNTVFIKPTKEELEDYIRSQGYSISSEKFMNYYDSCGWVIGKGKPMKDWKAAVRMWASRDNSGSSPRTAYGSRPDLTQPDPRIAALEELKKKFAAEEAGAE